jgi:hypothetical protein
MWGLTELKTSAPALLTGFYQYSSNALSSFESWYKSTKLLMNQLFGMGSSELLNYILGRSFTETLCVDEAWTETIHAASGLNISAACHGEAVQNMISSSASGFIVNNMFALQVITGSLLDAVMKNLPSPKFFSFANASEMIGGFIASEIVAFYIKRYEEATGQELPESFKTAMMLCASGAIARTIREMMYQHGQPGPRPV